MFFSRRSAAAASWGLARAGVGVILLALAVQTTVPPPPPPPGESEWEATDDGVVDGNVPITTETINTIIIRDEDRTVNIPGVGVHEARSSVGKWSKEVAQSRYIVLPLLGLGLLTVAGAVGKMILLPKLESWLKQCCSSEETNQEEEEKKKKEEEKEEEEEEKDEEEDPSTNFELLPTRKSVTCDDDDDPDIIVTDTPTSPQPCHTNNANDLSPLMSKSL